MGGSIWSLESGWGHPSDYEMGEVFLVIGSGCGSSTIETAAPHRRQKARCLSIQVGRVECVVYNVDARATKYKVCRPGAAAKHINKAKWFLSELMTFSCFL